MKDYILRKFLKYVKIDTMSSDEANTTPSTNKQFDLANVLIEDLKELGLTDIKLNEYAILTATLKSNCDSNLKIGFLAHMDTIPSFSGTNVKPNVIEKYDGRDIKLNIITISNKEFTFLQDLKGQTIITTDGTTVLGADDKAGIADIMGMLYYFHTHKDVKHTEIKVAFTPDEEIGSGIHKFNVKDFDCDFAYTVDGGRPYEINYENFNAASAIVTFNGVDIHPGSAKGHMINAARVAIEFDSLLPCNQRPEYTDGYDGFNHLEEMKGTVSNATLYYIIRNHDMNKFNEQKKQFQAAISFINNKYNNNVASLEIHDSYYNMKDLIIKDDRCIKRAVKAIKDMGLEPQFTPIRGGTDGAQLTYMGLNTPNLGTGGYNCHGPYELCSLDEMQAVSNILIKIAKEE